MPYDFQYVEAQKLRLTDEERKHVAKLYEQWSKEIKNGYNLPSHMSGPAKNKNFQMIQLRKALREEAKHISEQIEKDIKSSLYVMSDKTVSSMLGWMKDLGVNGAKIHATMASIPVNVVENLVNGSVYGAKGSWNLSKAIWGDNQKTLSSLYQIVAGGMAQNKTIFEIAQELSKYVNPRAAKQWNLKDKDGKRIYPKKVDYASQRLARTLSQHAYQQTVVQMNKGNPFILGIRWRANGSRACDICKNRDGYVFPVNELPLDHPNGMCVMEPIYLADADDMIAKWATSPAGTYPQFDEWAKGFGYDMESSNPSTPVMNIMRNEDTVKVAKQSYKNDKPFDPQEWYADEEQEDALLDEMRDSHTKYIKARKKREEAVIDYTGEDYFRDLNAWLRGDKKLEDVPSYIRDRVESLRDDLDAALDGSSVSKGIYLRRRGKFAEFQDVIGFTEDLYDLDDNDVLDALRSKIQGKVVQVNQYMSTSTKFGRFPGGQAEFFIKVNDDVNGMYVTKISEYGAREDEILLARGMKYVVKDVQMTDMGYLRFFMETI